ncbi:MAG: RHS repeat protein [Niabella sp.]|nr:RHS repeat protein [Niabella sp.]
MRRLKLQCIIVFILGFLFLVRQSDAFGQGNKFTPVTPEAAALTKMVNYPMNYNTGIPDIRIPFYEINVGGVKLPIELVYHAGGFRINEQATRVGLGWSLSSDLQITRSVNGVDDLMSNGYINDHSITSYDPSCPSCNYPSTGQELYFLATGEKEGAPDKFNYKLLNKSGSFYFQKNSTGTGYTVVPVPYNNIDIRFNSGQFIITDDDGTKYYFGEPGTGDVYQLLAKGMEVSGAGTDGTCFNCVRSSWKCNRIISAQGVEEISFVYENKSVSTYRSYYDYVEYYDSDPCGPWDHPYYKANQNPLNLSTTYNGTPAFYKLSSPKYLVSYANRGSAYLHLPYLDAGDNIVDAVFEQAKSTNVSATNLHGLSVSEIRFRGGKVQFNGKDKLNYIRVLDANNNEVKSMHFFQSYTTAVYDNASKTYNGAGFQGTRYLDSVHIKNGTELAERYALAYESKFCFGNHLKGHDAWGYPNSSTVEIAYALATSTDIFSLGNISVNQDRFFRDKDSWDGCANFVTNKVVEIPGDDFAEMPDSNAMRKGMLKRITYPTGGYTEFDFEPNRYTEYFGINGNPDSLQMLSGGLRIRNIYKYNAGSQLAEHRHFEYGRSENGSGLLMSRPDVVIDQNTPYYRPLGYLQEMAYLQTTNPEITCNDKSCLQIFIIDKKTTYQAASALDYTYESGAPVYYEEVTEYNQDIGSKTGKVVYEYYAPSTFNTWPAINHYGNNRIEGTNISWLKSDALMGAQKSIRYYQTTAAGNAGNNFTNTYKLILQKEFTYTRYLEPEQVRVTYAFMNTSYTVVAGDFSGNPWDLYETNSYFSNSGISPARNDFNYGVYGIPVGCLLPETVKETTYADGGSNQTVTSYQYGHLPYLNASKIIISNSKGEVIEKQFRYPYNFLGTAIYDTMLARNIIGAKVEEVEINTTLGNKELLRQKNEYKRFAIGAGVIAPEYIKHSVNGGALETEMHYDEYDQYGNVLQQTGRDGVPVSYLWGYQYAYPVAVLKGRSYASIPASYKSNTGIINPTDQSSLHSLLTSLNNTGEFANFYIYRPLVGLARAIDPTGRTTYYEYDAFGRLSLVKDEDGNILKRICYNYAGQVTDCGSGHAAAGSAQWIATGNTRCVKDGSNNNTGYQEREERDNNTISSTYNQVRWVNMGSNTSTCPLPYNGAQWVVTGNTRCVKDGSNNNTGTQEREERDNNATSATYNQLRWVNTGTNTTACPLPSGTAPNWQATGNTRCVKDGSNNNTGTQEREERDNNTSSGTYNQVRWVSTGTNTTACPLPSGGGPDWQATGELRCEKSGLSNTGNQEGKEVDMNPSSSTYNEVRWVITGVNTTSCPMPEWQFTHEVRCQKANGTNTGHQEQKEVDINTSSPSYGQIRWVDTGLDATSCPVGVNYLSYWNPTGTTYTATLTQVPSGQVFSGTAVPTGPTIGATLISNLPIGNYDVSVTPIGGTGPVSKFSLELYSSVINYTGTTFTASNLPFTSNTQLRIDPPYQCSFVSAPGFTLSGGMNCSGGVTTMDLTITNSAQFTAGDTKKIGTYSCCRPTTTFKSIMIEVNGKNWVLYFYKNGDIYLSYPNANLPAGTTQTFTGLQFNQ